MSDKMEITYLQEQWLDKRGGRTANDVLQDEKGLYVLMNDRDGKPTKKIYLPQK